jgi:hypothetical protein
VVTLSTGSTRVWAANGIFRSGVADSRGLSWTADGRELAFEWQANNVGQFPGVEARLLNLTSAGSDLLAASRRVIATTRQFKPAGYWFTQVLWSSPSGRVLIAAIPDGRMGVINGNEFTPLNMPPVSGTVMELSLGAGAGAW